MPEFRMPSLGADMEAGTLAAWKVAPGDAVKRGQVVAEVETAKGIIEVEIWLDGVVDALVVAPGATVPVGAVLATISGGAAAPGPSAAPAPPAVERAPPAAAAPAPSAEAAHPPASPAARHRARELGIDLARVAGTGPHGVITHGDVEKAAALAAAGAPVAPAARVAPAAPPQPMSMRQAIAAAMSRSKREIPHYYLATDVDLAPALAWLSEQNAARPVEQRVLPAALLYAAAARACREVPETNGFFVDGAFHAADRVHLGVALSLRGGGLVAPAIHDADRLPVAGLMAALSDLVLRARKGVLRSSELSDPTVTVTSLGDAGVERVYGVIYPPQVALVGFGRIVERPWASGGLLGVRPVVTVTLSADHRVSDGHRGALHLAAVARLLADPAPWAERSGA